MGECLSVGRGARDGRPATLRRSHRPDYWHSSVSSAKPGFSTRLGECKRGRVGHDGSRELPEIGRRAPALVASLLAPMPAEDVPLAQARGPRAGGRRRRGRCRCPRSTTPRWTATPCGPPRWRAPRSRCPSRSTSPRVAPTCRRCRPRAVARIMTGAPVPEGADAIVPGRADRRRHRDRAHPGARRVRARTCGTPLRTSVRAMSCSPRAPCSGPRRSAWRRPSGTRRCR